MNQGRWYTGTVRGRNGIAFGGNLVVAPIFRLIAFTVCAPTPCAEIHGRHTGSPVRYLRRAIGTLGGTLLPLAER